MARRLRLLAVCMAWLAIFQVGAFAADEDGDSRYVAVPVPATMIYAGQPLTPSMLRLRRVARTYLARMRAVMEPGAVEGKIARSTLVPGRPIPVTQLRDPDVIEASRPVRIFFRMGGMEIVGEAIPLASAAAGERVRARNVDTGLVVSGIAQADGSLLISGK